MALLEHCCELVAILTETWMEKKKKKESILPFMCCWVLIYCISFHSEDFFWMSLKRLLALVHPIFVPNLFWLTHFRLLPSAQEQESSGMEMLSWNWLADEKKKTYMTVTKLHIQSRDETLLICGELNHSTWVKPNRKWCRATEKIKDENKLQAWHEKAPVCLRFNIYESESPGYF